MKVDKFIKYLDDSQDHNFTGSTKTPIRSDAFDMSDDEKISLIKKNDPDYLDMLYRQKLNYVTEDEIIIKLK